MINLITGLWYASGPIERAVFVLFCAVWAGRIAVALVEAYGGDSSLSDALKKAMFLGHVYSVSWTVSAIISCISIVAMMWFGLWLLAIVYLVYTIVYLGFSAVLAINLEESKND